MTKFNVGDYVRVVETAEWNPEILVGSEGVITAIDPRKNHDLYPNEPWAEYQVLIPEQGIPLWVNKVEAIDND